MAHLPFAKLGVLLVKQATKPLARAVKARAVSSERLSWFCEFLGQTWHAQTTKLNLRVQGHKVKGVKPLNEQEAVQSGAELLSEGFVLSVGISALIFEARRSAVASAEKALQKAERRRAKMEAMQHLNDTVRDLAKYSVALRAALEEHDRKRLEYEKKRTHIPQIILPAVPALVLEITGGESKTDAVVAAHNKANEPKESWTTGLMQKLSLDSASSAIRYFGSIINGDSADVGDEMDDGDDDD